MKVALERLVSGISGAFDINEAFLSGALDVVIIESPDSTYRCSPFHVRFGKLKLLRTREKIVTITVNGVLSDLTMRLGKAGEAYFIDEDDLQTSQIFTSEKSKSFVIPGEADEILEDTGFIDPNTPIKLQAPFPKQNSDPKKKGLFQSIFTIFHRKPAEKNDEGMVLSLCLDSITSEDHLDKVFEDNIVPFEVFFSDPWSILNNPNLLLRINGKYCNWEKAAPIIVSMIAYKSLTQEIIEPKEKSPKEPIKKEVFIKKSLTLSSDKLKTLGLQKGVNTVVYEVNSRLQGVQRINCKIFLWDWTSRIVISDVDGTITKSDILGQILPMVGKDWSHNGVAKLYSDIVSNGYKILYLTSRAIGQAKITKEYLQSLNQKTKILPEGPLIMSHDRLFKSFVREVIQRTPQKFKAEKLREISGLFPEERNPFFAGFGNRETDAMAYKAAGVPLNKIFIINPESLVFVYNNTYAKTYVQLDELVYEMFPPVEESQDVADYEYSFLNYWKTNCLPLIDEDI